MTGNMIGQVCFYTAQLGYGFQYFITSSITWHREDLVTFRYAFVLLYNLLGNIKQADIGFCIGFLSSGDNPQIAVKECLQIVSGEVLHIGIRQPREY